MFPDKVGWQWSKMGIVGGSIYQSLNWRLSIGNTLFPNSFGPLYYNELENCISMVGFLVKETKSRSSIW